MFLDYDEELAFSLLYILIGKKKLPELRNAKKYELKRQVTTKIIQFSYIFGGI